MDSRMRNRVSCYISEDLLYHQAETVFEQIVHCLSFKIIQPLHALDHNISEHLIYLFQINNFPYRESINYDQGSYLGNSELLYRLWKY